MATVVEHREDTVVFEAVVRSGSGFSMFDDTNPNMPDLQKLKPPPGRATAAASELRRLNFRVRHIGTYSISAEGPKNLWEKTFHTSVMTEKRILRVHGSGVEPSATSVRYLRHRPGAPFCIPRDLEPLVERAYPQGPPQFFESPLPPRVLYHHLRAPDDIATILRANGVHDHGFTGRGVLVVMTDSGFYKHPFFEWHGYNYNATLAPDATRLERDELGHGTSVSANVFACARDIDFVGVKIGTNPTLAFKTAMDLHPAVLTNSWGYDLKDHKTVPKHLRPLEAVVREAVRRRGIVTCFSAGNGDFSFPGMMPDVISVGGVYADELLDGDDFHLIASDVSSSYDSWVYPGRHVPDVCGLVGMRPGARYLMLPVQPGCEMDVKLAAGVSSPTWIMHQKGSTADGSDRIEADGTLPDDGWIVSSGTSTAVAQVAGVCALLRQIQPGLSPRLVKSILKASARDVSHGKSAMGHDAGAGHDGATGAGLVDAAKAYRIARSITPRSLVNVPSPV